MSSDVGGGLFVLVTIKNSRLCHYRWVRLVISPSGLSPISSILLTFTAMFSVILFHSATSNPELFS